VTDRRSFFALPDSRLARAAVVLLFVLAGLFGAGAAIVGGIPVLLFQAVGTPSMEPTILCAKRSDPQCTAAQQASLFLVDKLTLRFRRLHRGDIVVFTAPPQLRVLCGAPNDGAPWIKRVVGLPGETVKERNASLYVDGRPVSQPYLSFAERTDLWGPYRVPSGEYFLVGDNRFSACDSRRGVSVPRSDIHGLVRLIWKRPPEFMPH
jgi:signal peptidase I